MSKITKTFYRDNNHIELAYSKRMQEWYHTTRLDAYINGSHKAATVNLSVCGETYTFSWRTGRKLLNALNKALAFRSRDFMNSFYKIVRIDNEIQIHIEAYLSTNNKFYFGFDIGQITQYNDGENNLIKRTNISVTRENAKMIRDGLKRFAEEIKKNRVN
jgi:hypothetical protein